MIAIEAKKRELMDEKAKNLDKILEKRMNDLLNKNVEIENLKKSVLENQEKNTSRQNEIKRLEFERLRLEKKCELLEQELIQAKSLSKTNLEEKNK